MFLLINDVLIPSSVSIVGSNAFSECKSLKISIHRSLTEIGWNAFFNCLSLVKVLISLIIKKLDHILSIFFLKEMIIFSSVTSIGSDAFRY